MLFAGHAFWAEVGGDISFVTLGEFLGSLKKIAFLFHWECRDSGKLMLKMLALVGQPSLRGRDAFIVFGAKGASWRNCRQNFRKTSFSPLFCFSVESNIWFFVVWSGSLASLVWSC